MSISSWSRGWLDDHFKPRKTISTLRTYKGRRFCGRMWFHRIQRLNVRNGVRSRLDCTSWWRHRSFLLRRRTIEGLINLFKRVVTNCCPRRCKRFSTLMALKVSNCLRISSIAEWSMRDLMWMILLKSVLWSPITTHLCLSKPNWISACTS